MPTQTKRRLQAEDLYRYQRIFDPQITPDGRSIIFCVERVDKKTEKKYVNLWLVPTGKGAARQFTHGDQNDTQPRWSPDGRSLLFLSNRGDEKQPQLTLLPIDGGEARPLTAMQGSFGQFEWSPDGKQIVCQFRQKDPEAIEREADERKKKLGVVARHVTRSRFKFDEQGYLPQSRWHIWTINAANGKATQLTDGDNFDESGPQWSPDGAEIIFFSNRSANPDIDYHLIDLYAIPSGGGELRRIETPTGFKGQASFSPDGRHIAYLANEGKDDAWQHNNVWLVPADGSAPAQNLTGHLDIEFSSHIATDTGDRPTTNPVWANDGRSLFVHYARHGATCVGSLSRDGRHLKPLIENGVVGGFSLDKAQTSLAYWFGSFTDLGQIRALNLAANRSRALTRFNKSWLRRVDLGQIEEIWFKGAADNDLQGWILKPPGFDPNQKYPAILEIHGGPWTQYGYSFFHEFYYLAAQGYVVYFTNPRGGQGYGEAHAKAIHRNWGQADYADLMAWTDYVAALPYIDTERMGVTGGSYGGYMTGWIVGQTNRFKAAVAQRMVSNAVSFWGSSDIGYFFEDVFSDTPPWGSLERYWDQSPMKYIANVKTPTLIIHSEQDLRCRQEQGEQFFLALKRLGIDSEMVLFPEEPHGLSRNGRTDRRVVRLNHIRCWFDTYLGS